MHRNIPVQHSGGTEEKRKRSWRRWIFWQLLQACSAAWLLQAISNFALPDHKADAFRSPSNRSYRLGDYVVHRLLAGYSRWDSEHFLHISVSGYTFENNAAFFPLFPGTVYALAELVRLVWPTVPVSQWSLCLICGFLISNAAFIGAGMILCRLTLETFLDDRFMRVCTLLYCISPASVFLHTVYSESLFALLSYGGIYLLIKRSPLMATILFSLAFSTRSNGVLLIVFIFLYYFRDILENINLFLLMSVHKKMCHIFKAVIPFFLLSMVIICPFVLYQIFLYWKYCKQCPLEENALHLQYIIYAQERGYNYLCEHDKLGWCGRWLPLSYDVIQKRYWNVGFLGYLHWRKVPNFLLASPTFLLVVRGLKMTLNVVLRKSEYALLLHVTILASYIFLCCNIEIATRLLFSSSPILYWIATKIILSDSIGAANFSTNLFSSLISVWRVTGSQGHWIMSWFLAYTILGFLLHCNFLPWT